MGKERERMIVDLLQQERGVIFVVSSCPAALLPEESPELRSPLCAWFCCLENPSVPHDQRINFSVMAETATWLAMSEGMGDGGLEWVLASWDTKPES